MSARVCSGCRELLPAEAYCNTRVYECRSCRNAGARARYARRAATPLRAYRKEAPEGFAERAGREWDIDLAAVYGVTSRTIRRWRNRLGIPPKDRLPYASEWGKRGMRNARELHPELMTGFMRPAKANAKRELLERVQDTTGITRPTISTPHLGAQRALMSTAMQAFARASARITEDDYS